MVRALTTSAQVTATDLLRDAFRERFDGQPQVFARAPGRVNLIGEHTDYNQGFVLPMAIDRACTIAARSNESNHITIRSLASDEEQTFSLCDLKPEPKGLFSDYVRGVVAGFCERGVSVTGFDAVVDSDIPLGSGLSSSAALEVATATLLEELTEHRVSPMDKALLCQKAEHQFVGVPCGLMDQYASVFGRTDQLMLLDCRDNECRYVSMAAPSVALLVINSNVRHKLAESEYAVRKSQCESASSKLGLQSLRDAGLESLNHPDLDDLEVKRVRHIFTENQRTQSAAGETEHQAWGTVGELMYASHASLRDDYQVSCAELDAIVEICQCIGTDGGIHGARMTGGGFGGCAIALVEVARLKELCRRIAAEYRIRTEIESFLFCVRPDTGAEIIPAS